MMHLLAILIGLLILSAIGGAMTVFVKSVDDPEPFIGVLLTVLGFTAVAWAFGMTLLSILRVDI